MSSLLPYSLTSQFVQYNFVAASRGMG